MYNSHITAMRAIRLNAGVVLSTITILNNGYISYGTDVMSAMYTSHNYIYIEKLVGGVDSNQSIALRSDVLEYNDIIAKVTDDIGITGEVCHTNTVRVEVDNSTETYGASGCVIAFDTLVNTNIVIIAETDQEHLPRINIEGVIVDKNTIDATIVGSNLSVVDMTPLHYRYHPDEDEIDPSGFNNSVKVTFTHPFVFLDGQRSIHLLGAGSYSGSNVNYDNTTVSYTYTLGPRPSATDNMSVIDDIIVLSKGINYNQYGAVGTTVYYVESFTTYVSCSDCQTPVSTRYVREIIGASNYDHRIVTSTETRKNEYTCGGSVYSRTCVDVEEEPVITQTTTRTDLKK